MPKNGTLVQKCLARIPGDGRMHASNRVNQTSKNPSSTWDLSQKCRIYFFNPELYSTFISFINHKKPKIMTALRQLLRTSGFLLSIVLIISLFCESCDNSRKQVPAADLAADTLQNKITTIKATALIKNFQSADGSLTSDFYFGGVESIKNRAVYFRLNPDQTQVFFEKLNQLKTSAEPDDSIQIRIHMALFGEAGTKLSGQPNLALLLNAIKISKNTVANDQVYFPLRPFVTTANRAISPNLADSLTMNWEKTSVGNLARQLFVNGDTTNPEKRIRYYTFNTQDTEEIHAYRNQNPDCGMFIYLGQFEEENHVPMRVIIRLTKNPNTFPQGKNGGEEDFEFAAQCPPICL